MFISQSVPFMKGFGLKLCLPWDFRGVHLAHPLTVNGTLLRMGSQFLDARSFSTWISEAYPILWRL